MSLGSFIKAERVADEGIYLKEERHKNPKERFKQIVSRLSPFICAIDSVLDVGCATGEFIYYLKSVNPVLSCTGIDVSKPMAARAKEILPDCDFFCKDILTQSHDMKAQYDLVTCMGVLQIFDNIEGPVQNLLRCVKQGGKLILEGVFNSHPVDVITRYRRVTGSDNPWELGWNIYSKQTYEKILKNSAYDLSYSWIPFTLPFDVLEGEDPMRTWTIKTQANPHQLVNGASLLIDLYSLEITVNRSR